MFCAWFIISIPPSFPPKETQRDEGPQQQAVTVQALRCPLTCRLLVLHFLFVRLPSPSSAPTQRWWILIPWCHLNPNPNSRRLLPSLPLQRTTPSSRTQVSYSYHVKCVCNLRKEKQPQPWIHFGDSLTLFLGSILRFLDRVMYVGPHSLRWHHHIHNNMQLAEKDHLIKIHSKKIKLNVSNHNGATSLMERVGTNS